MRPQKILVSLIGIITSALSCAATEVNPVAVMTVENDYARIAVATSGQILHFTDRQNGVDYCRQGSPFALVKKDSKSYAATKATYSDGRLTLEFGQSGVTAVLRVKPLKRYFVVEVISVAPEQIDEFAFVDIPLTITGAMGEPFAACALALNLKTNVRAIPQATSHLWAASYPRFGFAGAKMALIGCPYDELRSVMQEVVSNAEDLPQSAIGGPWALDSPNNYGSYLFDFGSLTEETVDRWIELAQDLGVTQIDFHGGRSFRFGDFRPDPKLYPRGVASMKAVIDKLHAAGIQAGLHTYAMFINKNCPYVTPVPDPRLGKDATFTLAADLTADAADVPVVESTENMSTITGFSVRNSVTLQIDDELIVYADISKEPPYAFTKCTRGACGTTVAAHEKGAKVHHLRECFGLFCPDGDSTLFTEIAANTANLYNEAGFDMIYLDALDGGDTVAGRANAWHYQSKFTFEICKRLKKPAIMEMSTFHHHLWYVRARMGAWDHPTRSHKKFIDIHCAANANLRRQFLPGNIGWWAFKTWQGATGEPTHVDDIEYLCAKALANNHSLSLMGISPSTVHSVPALPRLAAIVRRYECLRHANYFNDVVKEKLRIPGDEFTLFQATNGKWQFRPARYDKHKVQSLDGGGSSWTVTNRFDRQPLALRIETLMSSGAYDDPGNITLADFSNIDEFTDRAAQPGISADLKVSTDQTKIGANSGLFTATNTTDATTRSWCKVGKTFSPPANLSGHQGLGVWVYGDGKGEVLNLQQTSPSNLSHAIAEHYIPVDFAGWRYFELVEPEGKRHADYSWPYGGIYSIYRESIRPNSVDTLSLWYNNIPPRQSVACYLSPIRALPIVPTKLRNPSVTIGGTTITFPVDIETGQFLEFRGLDDCTLYGPKGEEIREVVPTGDVPALEPGENEIKLTHEPETGVHPRAYVSVISHGEPFGGTNPSDQIRWKFLRREDDAPHVIRALDGVQNQWDVICRPDGKNVRLEAEIIVESVDAPASIYSDPGAIPLETFDSLDAFADGLGKGVRYLLPERPEGCCAQKVPDPFSQCSDSNKGSPAASGVTHELALSRDVVKRGKTSARYTATSEKPNGCSARGKRFDPPIDLSACTDIGFLVHGDGNGQILNLQLRDTEGACHEMKVGIGFTGWKYREFSLADAKCDLSHIEYLILQYSGLPAGKPCTCYLDDIRALRDPTALRNPSLEVAGAKLVLPATLQPGQRLLYRSDDNCKTYDADGNEMHLVKPIGPAANLKPGKNRLIFDLDVDGAKAFQVRVRTKKIYRE